MLRLGEAGQVAEPDDRTAIQRGEGECAPIAKPHRGARAPAGEGVDQVALLAKGDVTQRDVRRPVLGADEVIRQVHLGGTLLAGGKTQGLFAVRGTREGGVWPERPTR